ncbi:hypothetical protein [Taibaiella soli]|uniref:Uncharacterized protein n=1 Tax=Taibaiella soli TaxID=1649169 RepID=A0A2W2AU67_9BACT|nr:hypothetical protein [Taibaiella soli]PZF71258.1 hypothetical protein DN068_18340 [Taibaiella soli]
MKKQLLIAVALCVVTALSCKKNDSNNTNQEVADNNWVLTGQGNSAAITSTKNDDAISFTGNSGATVSFFFKNYPTQNGVYKIVSTKELADNEVNISATSFSPLFSYWSTGNDNKTLTVKMNNGKPAFTCNNVWVADHASHAGFVDSVQLSTNVTQLQ